MKEHFDLTLGERVRSWSEMKTLARTCELVLVLLSDPAVEETYAPRRDAVAPSRGHDRGEPSSRTIRRVDAPGAVACHRPSMVSLAIERT